MSWRIPESVPLPEGFIGFDPYATVPLDDFSNYQRHLPHWRLESACYFATFRLDDSIPFAVARDMRRESEQWQLRLARAVALHKGGLPTEEAAAWEEFQRGRLRKIERILDEGHGACLLRDPTQRAIVNTALHHFEGQRCEMLTCAVMPNHVHVLCRPLGKYQIEDLCGSWKWFTAQKIQRALGDSGRLWQEETFDRIIRDEEHYAATVRYIARNPGKAHVGEDQATLWFCAAIREANGWPEDITSS